MAHLPTTRLDLTRGGAGFVLGVLLTSGAHLTGLLPVALTRYSLLLPVGGLVGAFLGLTRARALLWALGIVEAILLMVAVYLPVGPAITGALVRQDEPKPADAVVVLLSDIAPDANLPVEVRHRIFFACQPLRAGQTRRLLLLRRPGPWGSQAEAARREVRLLAGEFPVEETTPTASLREEVRVVCELARARGWSRIFLVCRPTATRRAATLFEASGLSVLCLPSGSTAPPTLPEDRVNALREWVQEGIALLLLRMRGVPRREAP